MPDKDKLKRSGRKAGPPNRMGARKGDGIGPSKRIRLTDIEAVTLDLFLHHALDAAAGDDRPDHGLAKMRLFWRNAESRNHLCGFKVRLGRSLRFPRQLRHS